MIANMTSFKIISVILYTLIILPNVFGYCDEKYNYDFCRVDLNCTDVISTQNIWSYQQLRQIYRDNIASSNCSYNNIPHNVIFKHDGISDEVPLVENSQDFSYIDSLDLSNNLFLDFPTLQSMPNLITLNMSYCFIKVAKLTNKYRLDSLKEIDLSNNMIIDIEIDQNEEPYESVESINMSYNKLHQIPDAVFESCSNLIKLDISRNLLDKINPNTFEGTKYLQYLNISYNKLTDINASLFRFRSLQLLDLSHNFLNHIKSLDLSSLTALTHLNLESNLITSIDNDSFVNMHNLHTLNLENNKIEHLNKDLFASSSELKIVLLSKNNLKSLPIHLFKGKSIQSLSIFENELQGPLVSGTFEGVNVPVLDLSFQKIDTVENNAFYGITLSLKVLLLQNNNITTLLPKSFYMLNNLQQLDLSNNKISDIGFEKEHLLNLESLSLRNNYLTVIKPEFFKHLDSLQLLDLSYNNIYWIESSSFESLNKLISFDISKNPLNHTLEKNTFTGLSSLPSFDISCTSLETIGNGSFKGMLHLKNLNMSHNQIYVLQYNSFQQTGFIEILDLSYNKLQNFLINTTQIVRINILYLNNNFIKTVNYDSFVRLLDLTKIFLSFNLLEHIEVSTFDNQKKMRVLDLSYNDKLVINVSLINGIPTLNKLYLSGTNVKLLSFDEVNHIPLTDISISSSSIKNVQQLKLNSLIYLENLQLSHNKITRVEVGCFTNISALVTLDLSFNEITYIQPGALRDNTMLTMLNVSHNQLTSIGYGILRGLTNLHTLDISYNSIDKLQNEQFFEVIHLNVLIADHNKIGELNFQVFFIGELTILSIGNNPIPCDQLVKFNKSINRYSYKITAMRLEEHNDYNVHGIVCKNVYTHTQNKHELDDDIKSILLSIRNSVSGLNVENHNTSEQEKEYLVSKINQTSKLNELKNTEIVKINEFNNHTEHLLKQLTNLTLQIANKNDTNILLDKILRVLTVNSLKHPTIPTPLATTNATYDNVVKYIESIKQQLEQTIVYEKNNIMDEVENKLSIVKSRLAESSVTESMNLVQENLRLNSSYSDSLFTETCVGLILFILVCFILYKFYKSGIFVRKRSYPSQRELTQSIDSSL